MSVLSDPGSAIVGELVELRIELRGALAGLAQRRPVTCSTTADGITVVCSDGAVFFQSHGDTYWYDLPPVPGTPAATAGATI